MKRSSERTWIIADTNFFLHFQQPDQIDWRALVATKQITLVIPVTVIDELDKHKNVSSAKLRARAKAIIARLKEIRRTEERSWGVNVKVEVAPRIPVSNMAEIGLDEERPDDKILAFAISYAKLDEVEPSRVFLISNDFGMELKAEGRGIQLLVLPDELQIPAELDASEKELRDLRKQHAALTNRMPILAVTVNDSGSRVEATLLPVPALTDDEIESKVARVKALHPLHTETPLTIEKGEHPSSPRHNIDFRQLAETLSAMGRALPTREQWNRYNSELEEFYQKYREFLRREQIHEDLVARSVFLDLHLVNSGTTPATDVRVKLLFPSGFQLIDYDRFPEKPECPPAPREPRAYSMVEMLGMGTMIPSGPPLNLPVLQRNLEAPNVRGFLIKPTNSFEVSCEVRKSMHGEPIFLRSVVAIFDSIESARSLTIDCKLICGELIDASESQIHVVINR